MTDRTEEKPTLGAAVTAPWQRFLKDVEPFRPDLYRYCRHLTRSPWDAEDLVQDTLARAFVTLGCHGDHIENPKGWLVRVATNQWLNQLKRAREIATPDAGADRDTERTEPREMREASGTLIGKLAPQERAAVVLKDVFDFTLEEISEALSTSVGAIKAALHRGRGKLTDPELEMGTSTPPAVLDAFADAFNRRDLEGLTALLLDTAVADFPGLAVIYGAQATKNGPLRGVLFGDPSSDRGGIAPQFRRGVLAKPPRVELRMHRGEPILVAWFEHADGEAVRALTRFELEGDRVKKFTTYLHQPEVIAEICTEMGLPFRTNGYSHVW